MKIQIIIAFIVALTTLAKAQNVRLNSYGLYSGNFDKGHQTWLYNQKLTLRETEITLTLKNAIFVTSSTSEIYTIITQLKTDLVQSNKGLACSLLVSNSAKQRFRIDVYKFRDGKESYLLIFTGYQSIKYMIQKGGFNFINVD